MNEAQPDPATRASRHGALCPVCLQPGAASFYSATAPVTCASVFADQAVARAVPTGAVDLVVCANCGFVFNAAFDEALGLLGARYESSQAASAHFMAFARSLAGDWVARYGLTGKTVLEVGCGGGAFLERLVEAGAGSAIGIDPLAPSSTSSAAIRTLTETFDQRSLDIQADALVCRHTLEHIADVARFLADVHAWAAQGRRVVLFELPDGERVFAERAFWDVYYEHCNYFTEATLRLAFESAGFEVVRLARVYSDQYLVLEAIARVDVAATRGVADGRAAQALCREFGADVAQSIARCERRLAALAADGAPLIVWQGASKTVGFLSALRNRDCVAAAVDLSVERHGMFLPGTGLQVHPPAALQTLKPRHVVLMNPVYLAEVRTQIRDLGVDAQVHSVNDLLWPGRLADLVD